MGTQKNRLNETVLLSTQNMLKLMGKKIFTILLYEQYNNIDIKVHNQIRKRTPFDFNVRKRINSKCNVVVKA